MLNFFGNIRQISVAVWVTLFHIPAWAAEDCPHWAQAQDALRWLRDAQDIRPRTVAECLGVRLGTIRSDISSASSWRPFLWESADFMHRQALSVGRSTEAYRSYLNSEIQARTTYREISAAMLDNALPDIRARLADDYARALNAETNALWLQAEIGDSRRLLDLHHLMLELDPVVMLDQTAVRWLEAIRTCPNWVPIGKKAIPDYRQAWCPSECTSEYIGASAKLSSWLATKSAPESMVTFSKKRGMENEVKKYCGAKL